MTTRWFEEYENYPIIEKSKIKWPFTKDFQVQGNYIVAYLLNKSINFDLMNEEELLKTSQACYNLISWSHQMSIMGFTGLQHYLDELLIKEFDTKNKIIDLQSATFKKWLKGKEGDYQIGDNYYTIIDKEIYYKKLDGSWWHVKKSSAFNIYPELISVVEDPLAQKLEAISRPSLYKIIYEEWSKCKHYDSSQHPEYDFMTGKTTPEKILDISVAKIRGLLKHPVSPAYVMSYGNLNLEKLEQLIKISYIMAKFTQVRRCANEHTVYLLRDCVMFDEIHKTLDILDKSKTSSDRLIVCRDLLTNKKRRGGHWYFVQEALFFACEKHPNNFEEFYNEFSQTLKDYEVFSEEFSSFIKKLAVYVDQHLCHNSKDVTFVDLGFQGSINILLKYVVENHSQHPYNHHVYIHMTVVAEWFKGLYKGMYHSDTYSLLTIIESLSRNEHMYQYVLGSFDEGKILVEMGSKEDQNTSNAELLVSTMVTQVAHKLKLL